MKVEHRDDGALLVSERLPVLRWGSLLGGFLLAGTLVLIQRAPEPVDSRAFAVGALVALFAFALAAFVPDRSFAFEPGTGRVLWSVTRLFSTREGELPFADVSSVIIQSHADSDSQNRRLGHRLVLVTSAGHLPLSNIEEFDRGSCEKLAGEIRALLGKPRVEQTPEQSIAELVEAGYVLDAVKRVRAEMGLGLTEAKAYVDSLRRKAA
jgi:hypothetical protein